MKVKYGDVRVGPGAEYGPGVLVTLTGSEVAQAIDTYLVAHQIFVQGPRTVRVNGELCEDGLVYVDPSGYVVYEGKRFSGRGAPEPEDIRVFLDQLAQESKKDWGKLLKDLEAQMQEQVPAPASLEFCLWQYESNQYVTGCGQSFTWTLPGGLDSIFSYCPTCGKAVQWDDEL